MAAVLTSPTLAPNVRSDDDSYGWPTLRRDWVDALACDDRLTAGSRALGMLLATRSNDRGKLVFGSQVRLAEVLKVSVRSIVRYVRELELLGYVRVFRSKPQRDADGKWWRRLTNRYRLVVPKRATRSSLEAPRRRLKAAYAVVSSHVHLRDSSGTRDPYREPQPRVAPPGVVAAPAEEAPSGPLADFRAQMRAAAAGLRGGTAAG